MLYSEKRLDVIFTGNFLEFYTSQKRTIDKLESKKTLSKEHMLIMQKY